MSDLTIHPARCLKGTLTLPGDKSISHRALLLGAISRGRTRITHCLLSGDVETTLKAIENLGVKVKAEGESVVLEGRPDQGLKPPSGPLDMGNSGTTARLLLGILAGHPFQVTLFGDPSLSSRPMRRVTEPLERMGATFQGALGPDRLPLTVQGGRLQGIHYELPVPSAQVKSALLFAALYAEGSTTVVESIPTRDHTERILPYLGVKLKKEGSQITVTPGEFPLGADLIVPGDFSSAAFFLVGATLVPGSLVTLRDIGLNPTRTGLLDLLKEMGAHLTIVGRETGWEPTGDVTVESSSLRAVTVESTMIPRVIDELPILMVAATQAAGTTRIEGAQELRVKETDRILSMVTGLRRMGAHILVEGDSILIEGPVKLKGTRVSSFSDHRTAMALAIAGLVAEGPTTIEESQWIDISFPGFAQSLEILQR